MKGVIALALREMVVNNSGEDTWKRALAAAGLQKEPLILPISDVDDATVLKVVEGVCKELGISLPQAADAFGTYWMDVYAPRHYPSYFRKAKNARDFLQMVDAIHTDVTENMRNARPPHFRYTWKGSDTLEMQYLSHRGLLDFVVGLAKAVGSHFGEHLTVTKSGPDRISIRFH